MNKWAILGAMNAHVQLEFSPSQLLKQLSDQKEENINKNVTKMISNEQKMTRNHPQR